MISPLIPHDTADADELLFVNDEAGAKAAGPVWRLLIVDDEPDVHRATLLALHGACLFSRPLAFLHAYSGAEAIEVLRRERDIAVVMLDVVMERQDAGLTLVKVIRDELKLADVRIILRTGQPGYAPDIETITAFDINDYRTKSELTRSMLFITLTAALRSYRQIKALEELAYCDSLCNLPNRNRFIALLDAELQQQGPCGDVAMAIIDIDDFSEVNDAFGHLFGDRTLQIVAQRLLAALGEGTTLARIGSDTFGVMGPSRLIDPAALLALFHTPFHVQSDAVMLSATVGLLPLPESKGTGQDALKNAYIALKRAKKSCRGGYVRFAPDFGVEVQERGRLLQALHAAVEGRRLFVVYQPQVRLLGDHVFGMEALLRWRTEEGRYIAPDQFIPLAEASGLIIALGDWVLRQACQELLRLQALGYPEMRMSVNVSSLQFRQPDFVDKLSLVISDMAVEARLLELEITESVAMEDPDLMLSRFVAIKQLGFSIAIDDFGTGYSSLSRLRQLPIDRLKIDRAFVNELGSDLVGGAIARMVVDLGRILNMTIIAEGIETQQQAQVLQDMGCQEGQGYFYARPMAPPELHAWLATRHNAPVVPVLPEA